MKLARIFLPKKKESREEIVIFQVKGNNTPYKIRVKLSINKCILSILHSFCTVCFISFDTYFLISLKYFKIFEKNSHRLPL